MPFFSYPLQMNYPQSKTVMNHMGMSVVGLVVLMKCSVLLYCVNFLNE